MRNNILALILAVFIVSFFTVGGCSGGDSDSSGSSQDSSGVNMDGEMSGGEVPTEELAMDDNASGEVAFIESGELPEEPQTFFYVEGGTNRQNLDFYGIEGLPNARDGLRPAILFIHGGGWIVGSKEDVDPFLFQVAEEIGFHVVSINYRLANDNSTP